MNMPPRIISTKDLAYLSDLFELNYTAFKQIESFINEVKDEKIKELLERIRNMHEDHMNFIISILKKEDQDDDEYDGCDECKCDECECEDEEDIDEE